MQTIDKRKNDIQVDFPAYFGTPAVILVNEKLTLVRALFEAAVRHECSIDNQLFHSATLGV